MAQMRSVPEDVITQLDLDAEIKYDDLQEKKTERMLGNRFKNGKPEKIYGSTLASVNSRINGELGVEDWLNDVAKEADSKLEKWNNLPACSADYMHQITSIKI